MRDYNRIRDLKQVRESRSRQFEPYTNPQPAKIFSLDGSIYVPGLPNFVWVHQFGMDESPMAVRRGSSAVTEGLWVWIGPSPKPPHQWEILGHYSGDMEFNYYNYVGNTSVAAHAPTHEWPTEATKGYDAVKVFQPALQMLKTTGDNGSLVVDVSGVIYGPKNKRLAGTTFDLTSYVPASDSVPVLLYLDIDTDSLDAVTGTYTSGGDIYTPGSYTYPQLPSSAIPSAYIILSAGQTEISTTTDIFDARTFLHPRFHHPIILDNSETLTISSGAIEVTTDYHTIAAESGTTDTLDTITPNENAARQLLMLEADTGDTITVSHGTGNIYLSGEADYSLESDRKLFLFWDGTIWFGFTTGGSASIGVAGESYLLFSQTADQQVINTVSQTTLLSSGQGTKTITGGSLKTGSHIIIEGSGYISTNGSPTLALAAQLEGTDVLTSGSFITDSGITDVGFEFEIDITVRVTGASGQVIATGTFSYNNGAYYNFVNTSPTSIDTSADITVDVLATWGTASLSNYITSQSAKIIVETPPTEITDDVLLMETGDSLLLETGDFIKL